MPHLYKHISKGWEVRYYLTTPNGLRKRKSIKRQQKSDAEIVFVEVDKIEKHSRTRTLTRQEIIFGLNMRYITQAEANQLHDGYIAASQSWDELSIKYEAWSRSNCAPYTHRCNSYKLNKVIDAIGDISPEEVTEGDVEGYIALRKRQGVSSVTIDKELIVLRKLLDYVDPENNPARRVNSPKTKGKKRRPFSMPEMQAFFGALELNSHFLYGRLKHIVYIYLYAGMRPSEILRLRDEDINLETMKIYAWETKTDRPRAIDIHPDLVPLLKELLSNPQGEKLISDKLTGDSISRKIREVMQTAGIKGCTPYSLRHSFVSYLLKHTRDLAYVMKQAGHTNITTTQGYIDFVEDPESPINKLDFGLNKSTTDSATVSPAEKKILH